MIAYKLNNSKPEFKYTVSVFGTPNKVTAKTPLQALNKIAIAYGFPDIAAMIKKHPDIFIR
jgi:hypothetical protein